MPHRSAFTCYCLPDMDIGEGFSLRTVIRCGCWVDKPVPAAAELPWSGLSPAGTIGVGADVAELGIFKRGGRLLRFSAAEVKFFMRSFDLSIKPCLWRRNASWRAPSVAEPGTPVVEGDVRGF